MEPPGTPPLFSDDVPLCLKKGLEMNAKTSLTFLYKQHVPLEQVPESSKNKASKSEKNPEKKPEEEPEKKPEEEPEKKPEEEPETQEEESGTEPWPETQPEHRGEAVLAVLQDLEDVFKWNLETESA